VPPLAAWLLRNGYTAEMPEAAPASARTRTRTNFGKMGKRRFLPPHGPESLIANWGQISRKCHAPEKSNDIMTP